MDTIPSLISQVDQARLANNLFYLAKHPLPCRTLNRTLPGHDKSTLHEADDFIQRKLESWGYKYARKVGKTLPRDVIIVVSHKDSQSWIDGGPGASDNGAGTVGMMEIARLLSGYPSERSIWFVFCNEEHWPWTSVTAARNIAQSDVSVIAVLNIDSIGSKSQLDRSEGRMVNVTRYTTPEGEGLADLMAELNQEYDIGLTQEKCRNEHPSNDDGSFIKAGMPATVHNAGSAPNASPYYHSKSDVPEYVDVLNVTMATQLSLAAVMHLDIHGR